MGGNQKQLIMETMNRPQVKDMTVGTIHKVLEITGLTGMIMPPHHSTGEVVRMVKQGEALIKMPDTEYKIGLGDVSIIPAKKEHTLTVLKELKALVIMPVESEIQFI
jgi:mannose-6-phosphate isomerase-like protein (cupin superfamily)